MSITIIPDSYQIDGPWFISKDSLSKLDKVIKEVWNIYQDDLKRVIIKKYDIKEISEDKINQHIKKHFATHTYDSNYIRVSIYLNKNKLVKQYESIKDVLKDVSLSEYNIIGLKIVVKSLDNALSIEVSKDNFKQSLSYRVESSSMNIKEEVIYIFNNWIDKTKPKKLVEIWKKLFPYNWLVVWFIFIVLTTSWNSSGSYSNILKDEAREYIVSGINENNEYDVLNLLLQLSTDYVPESQTKNYASHNTIILIIVVIAIISSIAPRTTIGIGKGEAKLKAWLAWQYIITIFIPLSIILPIILSRI